MVKRSAFDSNGGRGRTAELNGSDEPLLGLEEAPSLAVDGFQGAVITNGVVKINFFTVRNDPVQGRFRKAECVMSISLASLAATRDAFDTLLNQFERAAHGAPSAQTRRKLSS